MTNARQGLIQRVTTSRFLMMRVQGFLMRPAGIVGGRLVNVQMMIRGRCEMDLLSACKLAYRKHHLNDDTIGWEELGDCLLDALCNEMGDDGFQEWLASCKIGGRDGN